MDTLLFKPKQTNKRLPAQPSTVSYGQEVYLTIKPSQKAYWHTWVGFYDTSIGGQVTRLHRWSASQPDQAQVTQNHRFLRLDIYQLSNKSFIVTALAYWHIAKNTPKNGYLDQIQSQIL